MDNQVHKSCSINEKGKGFVSKNPFVNFMMEFKKKTQLTGKQLLICAGEKWRSMSSEEKKPYVDAAKLAKTTKREGKSKDKCKPAASRATKTNSQPVKKENQKFYAATYSGARSGSSSSSSDATTSRESSKTRSRSSRSGKSSASDYTSDSD